MVIIVAGKEANVIIKFENGSVIEWDGKSDLKESIIAHGRGSAKIIPFLNEVVEGLDDELVKNEFEKGSFIYDELNDSKTMKLYICQEEQEPIVGMTNKKALEVLGMKSENGYNKEETLKFMNEHGEIKAEIPADNELLNAIVGYQHDPQTHVYNRAERRRIIKAAKELDKKYKKKGGK